MYGFLTLVMVILKLAGIINWSWWIVFLPTLVQAAGIALVFVVGAAASRR